MIICDCVKEVISSITIDYMTVYENKPIEIPHWNQIEGLTFSQDGKFLFTYSFSEVYQLRYTL